MDPENPYEPSSSLLAGERNEGDTLEPVAVEPRAILQRCWELFQRNPGTVLGAVLIPLVASILFVLFQQTMSIGAGFLAGVASDSGDTAATGASVLLAVIQFFLAIVSWILSVYFQLGTVRIYTRLARGLPADLTLLFGEWVRIPAGMAATLLLILAVMAGLVLLVVPGIILALGFQLCLYTLVDQDLGPIESLRESWRLTDGHKLALFIVNVVMTFLALGVTCLTCGLGYFAAIPILSLAQSVIYHSLLHLKGPRLEGM